MSRSSSDLYSDAPLARLEYTKSLTGAAATRLRKKAASKSPYIPWPYGMPTSVNPYVLCLGISPGARRNKNDCGPYDLPTVGTPHSGFGGKCALKGQRWDATYWQKIRELCVGIVQGEAPSLTRMDCLSLSGHLNLGTEQDGRGHEGLIETKVATWLPNVILEELRPRVLICFGLWKLLSSNALQRAWVGTPLERIIREDPKMEESFIYGSRTYRFRFWQIPRKGMATPLNVILWPNHPSRHPFGGGVDSAAWKESIAQAKRLLRSFD